MSVPAECISQELEFFGLGEETPWAIVSFLLGFLLFRVARSLQPKTATLTDQLSAKVLYLSPTLDELPSLDQAHAMREGEGRPAAGASLGTGYRHR
mmetsp:Transcript_106480/g.189319  ORF Transcript_106480/g.189319 Transcript_106480/m.189319 type:complete len:96 (-) Transcript_106480:81-368(-)